MAREDIEAAIATLNPREEYVLRLRFGLGDNEPKTLEEIGKILDVSKSMVSHIIARALRKMKHPSIRKKIKDYYENLDDEKFIK